MQGAQLQGVRSFGINEDSKSGEALTGRKGRVDFTSDDLYAYIANASVSRDDKTRKAMAKKFNTSLLTLNKY